MSNLDLTDHNLDSLETTFVVTKQLPGGAQRIVEAGTDAADIDELRKQHEAQNTETRFRVYRVGLDIREQYRTFLPGDARFELAERTGSLAGRERQEWAVAEIGKTPTFISPILDEGHAQLVCDLQNKLPEGYTAYYRDDLRDALGRTSLGAGIEVVYHADYTPDAKDDWRASQPFDRLDVLLGHVESHHGTEDKRRAKYAEEQAAEEQAKAKAEASRRIKVEPRDGGPVWFFMPAKATEIANGDDSIWITAKGRLVIENWDETYRESTFVEADVASATDWFINHDMDPSEYEKTPEELRKAYADREH